MAAPVVHQVLVACRLRQAAATGVHQPAAATTPAEQAGLVEVVVEMGVAAAELAVKVMLVALLRAAQAGVVVVKVRLHRAERLGLVLRVV